MRLLSYFVVIIRHIMYIPVHNACSSFAVFCVPVVFLYICEACATLLCQLTFELGFGFATGMNIFLHYSSYVVEL